MSGGDGRRRRADFTIRSENDRSPNNTSGARENSNLSQLLASPLTYVGGVIRNFRIGPGPFSRRVWTVSGKNRKRNTPVDARSKISHAGFLQSRKFNCTCRSAGSGELQN